MLYTVRDVQQELLPVPFQFCCGSGWDTHLYFDCGDGSVLERTLYDSYH